MLALHHFLAPMSECHAAYALALALVDKREIDVQTRIFGKSFVQYLTSVFAHNVAHRTEVGIMTEIAKGEGYRRNAAHGSLDGYSNGAAILRIDRGIVSVIDASEYEVWHAWAHLIVGHLHTVYWSARTAVYRYSRLFADKMQRQGQWHRESTRLTRTGAVRGTHYDVTHIGHHVYEGIQAFGLIAVIIADEYKRTILIHNMQSYSKSMRKLNVLHNY